MKVALEAGFRHIDTATAYGNEKEVGEGIKLSGVPRDQIFLTTKLDPVDMGDPKAALDYSLKQLDTPYLDLCACSVLRRSDRSIYFPGVGLLHWPAPLTKVGAPPLGWTLERFLTLNL